MIRSVRPVEIGIVLYPGVQLAAVYGLTDLLAIAERLADQQSGGTAPSLRVTHWRPGVGGRPMSRVHDTRARARTDPSVLVLPPTLTDLPGDEVLRAVADWLRQRYRAGALLCSVCSGAFLLAETGLLSGRAVSTHWSCAGDLAARFPDIRVDSGLRLVDHGDLLTAGGFMGWIDLGLRVVERTLGPSISEETARFLSSTPEGTPAGFRPPLAHGDAAILRAQQLVHRRDGRDVSLAAMAGEARLERRTFLRRFARATGATPSEYCRRVRVARAQELLEASGQSAAEIAWAVGYASPASFARVFRRLTGTSPGAYRRDAAAERGAGPGGGSPTPAAALADPADQ